MKLFSVRYLFIFMLGFLSVNCFAQSDLVSIHVDLTREKGPMKPLWAWFGYDEPNFTYMKDGRKLLTELAALSPVPVYVRAHNLMTSGDGTPALKWGSTNMYTEDIHGKPVYNWTIIDSIFDSYIERKMKPLAQIGFMPEALSTNPKPYQHKWSPGNKYESITAGWAYPPNDYSKWAELIFQWVKHSVDRYGKAEVESWYWELWNEPDSKYLMSEDVLKTYCKMYDYASDAVRRALPTARIGGPHTTSGANHFLEAFLKHCISGTNEVTGKLGAPLDFVAFHAKGAPKLVDGKVQMGIMAQFNKMGKNFEVISSFPELKGIPVIIGESDPEGCAACSQEQYPQNAYRNGTMYSSYTAASVARLYDMADYYHINLIGAVNWSFEFENQSWFYGFRDLATNGVDKPVLNVFRMLGRMSGNRVEVSGDMAYDFLAIRDSGVRGQKTDVNALAAKDIGKFSILLWNYHDDDISEKGSTVELTIDHPERTKAKLFHYRIDQEHSNSYEAWKKMGSPQNPSTAQITELEKAGQLQLFTTPEWIKTENGRFRIKIELPRQGVSLLQMVY